MVVDDELVSSWVQPMHLYSLAGFALFNLMIACLDLCLVGKRTRTTCITVLHTLGNFIYLSLGGIFVFAAASVITIALAASLLGLPIAQHSFEVLVFLAVPFGRHIVHNRDRTCPREECTRTVIILCWLLTGAIVTVPLLFFTMLLIMFSILFAPMLSKFPDIYEVLLNPVDKTVQFGSDEEERQNAERAIRVELESRRHDIEHGAFEHDARRRGSAAPLRETEAKEEDMSDTVQIELTEALDISFDSAEASPWRSEN